ncbi:MAG: hypothetical protein PUK16_03855 [Prevotellaceae bacterium]|nr:hypothetical protein [Prevotella sp.]MDD7530075.1 hypothetical protein [Prevotellaceae bacterium]MDY2634445.1 hypothetical protein [Prevotella sp.]
MRKGFYLLLVFLLNLTGVYAQEVTVPEPEFADQTYLLTSNTTYEMLPRETGIVKTKAGASLYLTGIGKVKTRLTLSGPAAKVSVPHGPVRLIIKAANNETDPASFINIFAFEVKGKERRALLAEAGTLSATKSKSLGQIDYNAKKYGKSSYYLVIDNLEPGEYGISLGDPDKQNEKNDMRVTTFSVK